VLEAVDLDKEFFFGEQINCRPSYPQAFNAAEFKKTYPLAIN
jgi:hypothetical protein